MWTIVSHFYKLLTLLFPPSCYVCHKEGDVLCTPCIQSLRKSIDTPHRYIHSLYSFKDIRVKRIIHAIKYYHRRDLVQPLLYELNNYQFIRENKWILVPVPMLGIRKYIRGYNQAEVIAQTISTLYSLEIHNTLLKRSSYRKRQVKTSSRSLRIQNQKKSFSVIASVQNLNIILIDDVTTTGATLDEARHILLKHGARNVVALTLAH